MYQLRKYVNVSLVVTYSLYTCLFTYFMLLHVYVNFLFLIHFPLQSNKQNPVFKKKEEELNKTFRQTILVLNLNCKTEKSPNPM